MPYIPSSPAAGPAEGSTSSPDLGSAPAALPEPGVVLRDDPFNNDEEEEEEEEDEEEVEETVEEAETPAPAATPLVFV
jgi:hypothetical protein